MQIGAANDAIMPNARLLYVTAAHGLQCCELRNCRAMCCSRSLLHSDSVRGPGHQYIISSINIETLCSYFVE